MHVNSLSPKLHSIVNRDVGLHTVDGKTSLWKGGTHIHTANKWQGQDSDLGPSKHREPSLVLTAHSAGTAVKASPAGSFLPEAQPAVQCRISPGACCLCSCLLTIPYFWLGKPKEQKTCPCWPPPLPHRNSEQCIFGPSGDPGSREGGEIPAAVAS